MILRACKHVTDKHSGAKADDHGEGEGAGGEGGEI